MHNLDDLQAVLESYAPRTESETVPATDMGARGQTYLCEGSILPAFSGRYLTRREAHYGFAPANNSRNLDLLRPSGARRPAPCSVNAVAFEAIRAVPDGGRLKVAMYAMSARVPEYGALIEAARRGCPIEVLLDRKIGKVFGEDLAARAKTEGLPITVRGTNRRMHQNYILAQDCHSVVTGTANLTQDSANHHAEYRILFRNDPALAAQFETDFNTIWQRVA